MGEDEAEGKASGTMLCSFSFTLRVMGAPGAGCRMAKGISDQ